jgi:HD-like signal output (HDOD) protein
LSNKCNLLQGNVGRGYEKYERNGRFSPFVLPQARRSTLGMIAPEEFLAAQVMKGSVLVPPYPAVALRVHELLSTASFTMSDLAQLIASDAALALRVITLANSAANRPTSGPIGSIDLAVARIGVTQVAELALAAALAEGACMEGPLVHFRFLAWRKSLASAFLAQEIAGLRGHRRGEGFLVGLLRDFGQSVCLATLEPAVLAGKVSSEYPPREILGATERFQKDVSRRIAERWNLPEPFRKALADESPEGSGPSATLARIGSDGSRVARLVESYPAVTDKMLASVLPDAAERARILTFLPLLPENIAALGPQTQATGTTARQAQKDNPNPPSGPRAVAKPPAAPVRSPLPPQPSVRVRMRKGSDAFTGELSCITPEAATLLSPRALPLMWITEISLDAPGTSPSFWIRVEQSRTEGRQVRMQVAPYGLDSSRLVHWTDLIERLRAAG